MFLNNLFPLVIVIIEVVKRVMNDLEFHFMPAIEIILYLVIFICVIKGFCCSEDIHKEVDFGLGSFFCLFITWIIDIILYFNESYFDEKQPEKLIEFFIKFKIYGLLIVTGIDFTSLISIAVLDNCCYKS